MKLTALCLALASCAGNGKPVLSIVVYGGNGVDRTVTDVERFDGSFQSWKVCTKKAAELNEQSPPPGSVYICY